MIFIAKYLALLFYLLLMLLFTYQWLSFVLAQFPQSRVWGLQLNGYLYSVATQIMLATLNAIPGIFIAFIIFMIARFVVRALKKFFDSVAMGRTKVGWMDADVANTSRRIISVVVWVFAFAMAYPYLPGSETAAFKGISVLLGLMLSLGASSLVSQAGSGLILTYTRIYRPGEFVGIAEYEGTVTEMGLFTTRIRTGMGVELALPNSYILSNVTKNYSRAVNGVGFVVDATVTIGYDTPWRQVHAMLIEAAMRTPGIAAEPAPRVFQVALSDFYPEYRLVCHAMHFEARPRAEVITAVHANIQDVFNEYGVQIMSPHYFGDPAEEKIVATDKFYSAPAKPPLK
jgi:small-conductance mechanosensitive channel